MMFMKGSYRTYEEWKRVTSSEEEFPYLSSYRTYEEWKHKLLSSSMELKL